MKAKIYLFFQCFFISLSPVVSQVFDKITTDVFNRDGGNSHGIAFGDYNRDGFSDVFVSNLDEADFLYKNNGDGTFSRVDDWVGDKILGNTASANWVDVNNDGLKDLFLARGSTFEPIENILYLNEKDSFSLVDSNSGLFSSRGSTESVVWADFDNDGDLDMFEVNWQVQQNHLYQNQGGLSFKQDTISGITDVLDWAVSANMVDVNNDNFVDLFVARQGYPINAGDDKSIHLSPNNSLYLGSKNGFETSFDKYDPLVHSGGSSITSSWGDVNNDGYLDVFIGNFDNQGNFLFINKNGKEFQRVYDDPVVLDRAFSVGSAFGDLDNDGDLDLFVSNGYQEQEKNFLYMNKGNGTFEKITSGSIVEDEQTNVACALEDFDNDGDLDVFVTSRNGANNLFYKNETNESNNWFKIKCRGVESNKDGIGTKIRVSYQDHGVAKTQYRQIHQLSGYGAHSESIAHFGLAQIQRIDSMEVTWSSGTKQKFLNLEVNKFYIVTEGENKLNEVNKVDKTFQR